MSTPPTTRTFSTRAPISRASNINHNLVQSICHTHPHRAATLLVVVLHYITLHYIQWHPQPMQTRAPPHGRAATSCFTLTGLTKRPAAPPKSALAVIADAASVGWNLSQKK